MFKVKYILLLTLSLSACRVKKDKQVTRDKTQLDASQATFKSGLSDITTSTLNGVTTITEYEYPALTPAQQAIGQTEPKARIKQVTQTTFNNVVTNTKKDSVTHTKTAVKQVQQHEQEHEQKVVSTGFPVWLLIVAALIAAGLLLYHRYGNLINLAKSLFK